MTIIKESLPVSHFRIDEEFVYYDLKQTLAVNQTDSFFEDLVISFPEQAFHHYKNEQYADKPKLLIFGDSYLATYLKIFE